MIQCFVLRFSHFFDTRLCVVWGCYSRTSRFIGEME